MVMAAGLRRALKGLSEAAFRERFGTEEACRKALFADSDETGQAFQSEAGHPFRREAGRCSDLKPATWAVAPGSWWMVQSIASAVKPAWFVVRSSGVCAGSRR